MAKLTPRSNPIRWTPLVALASLLVACGSEPSTSPQVCVAVDPTCTPAYEPTFSNVYQKTLQPSCAYAGPSCHASSGRKAGIVFDDPESAYRSLLEGDRIVPGKADCSLVTRKLVSTDTSFMMPPGLSLPAGEQCAIVQWIARGAPR